MKLSILMPAYNYPEGIKSILLKTQILKHENRSSYEIIIFDNSFNDRVYNLYKIYKTSLNIYYKKIPRSVGAVNNWNFLLKQCSGNFIYMIHHDDLPEHNNFFRDLIKRVQKYKNYDIFIYNCRLKSKHFILNRPNFSFYFKKIIINYFPKYLLRRNVIGSISNIVFRNKNIFFNKKLQWLVDVDFYYRLIKNSNKIIFFKKDNIISSYQYAKSISRSLIKKKNKYLKETNFLKKYDSYKFLNFYQNFFIDTLESLIWYSIAIPFRLFYIIANLINIK